MFYGIKLLQVKQFALEMAKEILYYRIVITVSFAAHTLLDTFVCQHLHILIVPVMPTLVGMKQQVCIVWNFCKGLFQHSRYHQQIGTVRYCVCHNVTAIQVKNY